MSTSRIPRVAVGDVIWLKEPDYMYGVGPLVLRVMAVGAAERHADGLWLNLRGIALRADGAQTHSNERYALVRLNALPCPSRSDGES